jgi:hypothetical protein
MGYTTPSGATPAAGGAATVITAVKDTVVSDNTADTWQDIPGLSVTISPSSASRRVRVSAEVNLGILLDYNVIIRVLRGTTVIGSGAVTGGLSNQQIAAAGSWSDRAEGNNQVHQLFYDYVDSPGVTTATVYKVQWISYVTQTYYLNRPYANVAGYYSWWPASHITVEEVI